MKIWCNVHDAEQSVPGVMCWKKEVRMIGALRRHCRFVEMQLVPADARIVSKDALVVEKVDGEWPEEVIDKAASAFDNSDRVARRLAIACLDALSVPDPTKTEPPKDPWDYDP